MKRKETRHARNHGLQKPVPDVEVMVREAAPLMCQMRWLGACVGTLIRKVRPPDKFMSRTLPSLVLSAAALQAAPATFSERAGEIRAATSGYTLANHKAPYALSVRVGDREILSHGDGPGPRVVVGSWARRLGSVTRWQGRGDTLFLSVTTGPDGPEAAVSMVFRAAHIEVRWRTERGEPAARLEENFPLKTGGHWFGGNVTSGHQWPLETGESVLDPFQATSNQTTPVWFASSGAGVFVPTYEQMGFSINRAKDGLLSFHVKNAAGLDYRLIAAPNIADAHRVFVGLAGKPEVVPPKEYFEEPIFNTWIEYMTKVSQSDMETYARKIRESGFPGRVLMLDDELAGEIRRQPFPQR